MGKHSIRKGKVGEREAAKLTGGKRTWEHLHDLFAHGRWWEVKREAKGYTKVYGALYEHKEHFEETGDGPVPSVLIRQDRERWVVAFFYSDWVAGRADFRAESQD